MLENSVCIVEYVPTCNWVYFQCMSCILCKHKC